MQGEMILVTGGAGFIGSNLAEALAEENDVVILDDLSTGKLDNIKNLPKKVRSSSHRLSARCWVFSFEKRRRRVQYKEGAGNYSIIMFAQCLVLHKKPMLQHRKKIANGVKF